MSGRDLEALADGLGEFLGQRWGRAVRAESLVPTSTGARRENVLFDAVDASHPAGARRVPLVVTIYPPAGTVLFGVEAETDTLRLAERAGAPVAHVHEVCTDSSWFGEPFFISSRVEGETLPKRVLRTIEAAGPDQGERVAAQLGRAFAAIHRVDATEAPAAIRQPLDVDPASHALATLAEQIDELAQPAPGFELGLRWLRHHLPSPAPRRTLVHGDVRTGNIVVDAGGLAAVLDWEGAHTGDPHRDLAWCCVRTWRFDQDHLEVGGFGSLDSLTAAYVEAGGHFDPASFHWWKVAGTLRWGIGLSRQAAQHLAGVHRSIVMAASGRRAVECEHDLLRLLAPKVATGGGRAG
ncbi:MAG: phosphotransferase family protein [Acidimicrobiia bacterium]|nr:phosphotransferase family protein [Acidimicrobiia bacterium]